MQDKITRNMSIGIGDVLLRAGALQQSLNQIPDYRSLLRRFGAILHAEFGVSQLGFARLGRQKSRLHLKRRYLRIPEIRAYGEEFWSDFEQALNNTGVLTAAGTEGLIFFEHNGRSFHMCVIEDPKSRCGRLAVWEIPEHSRTNYDSFGFALLEYLVQILQAEGRWHRKLAGTQSLLYIDDLTGLFNHRYLEICLENELRRADRFQNNFCMMFIDLDSFKPVNDTHGHISGSSVLRQVADVIKDAVREVDIPIRYGGDEFVVLLLGASSSKGLLAAERVRRAIERTPFKVEGGGVAHVTASIGIASYPEHGRTKDSLLKIADESMYKSKNAGKNRVTILPATETDPAVNS
jgi:diguanylate cyclase (GGDEF)-like protein